MTQSENTKSIYHSKWNLTIELTTKIPNNKSNVFWNYSSIVKYIKQLNKSS